MNGEFCDYMKENPVNYAHLNLQFKRDYAYRTKAQLDNKTALYEHGINNYTTLAH